MEVRRAGADLVIGKKDVNNNGNTPDNATRDYHSWILFYDPADLAAVVAGGNTWDPQPVATMDLNEYMFGTERALISAGYDAEENLLYLTEYKGDGVLPLIHVFLVRGKHPGDANGDGAVDYLDLGILATNYDGTGKTFSDGDFNEDGNVDYLDLGILATEYDWVAPGAAAVPAPAPILLIGLALPALIRRRRRGRRE